MLPRMETVDLIQPEIKKCLEQIQSLAPKTSNPIVKQLQDLHQYFENASSDEAHKNNQHFEKQIEHSHDVLIQAKRLIHNLKEAKEAVSYVQSRLEAANEPYDPVKTQILEKTRAKINTDKIKKFYSDTLYPIRKKIDPDDVQSPHIFLYRKGVGTNIRLWALHTASHGKDRKGLGNCTEQANVAFSYLYSKAYEHSTDHKEVPFNRLERIDIENNRGGHCYLLLDRNSQSSSFSPTSQYSVSEFIKDTHALGDTCVVIDPWNKENPFYPVSDIQEKMPDVGLRGDMNIEFGIDLSTLSTPPSPSRTLKS